MRPATDDEIRTSLAALPGWALANGQIERTYRFADFLRSMAFVESIAGYAERAQHHPDILVRYNRVTLAVSTHDAGGITEKDFALARFADGTAPAQGGV